MSFVLALLLVAGLAAPALAAGAGPEPAELLDLFRRLDRSLKDGDAYSRYDNEAGSLAWGQSYAFTAYLDAFLATGDQAWLEKLRTQAARVLAARDDVLGRRDAGGHVRVGWGTSRYSTTGRLVWQVHSAMIVLPLVLAADVVGRDPALKRFASDAEQWTATAVRALGEFDDRWIYDPARDEGCYVREPLRPVDQRLERCEVLNTDLVTARVFEALARLGAGNQYEPRLRALLRRFRATLRSTADGRYVWPYRYGHPRVEDLSHASTYVAVVLDAVDRGMVFTRADGSAFVRTFLSARRGAQFHTYVDGSGPPLPRFDVTPGLWLDLARIDCQVHETLWAALGEKFRAPFAVHPADLAVVAKFLRYARCQDRAAGSAPVPGVPAGSGAEGPRTR
jgi:hypothetical protein